VCVCVCVLFACTACEECCLRECFLCYMCVGV